MSDAEFVHHNTPDPAVKIEPVGTVPKITYHVEWPEMKHPTPRMFYDVGQLEIKLAVLGTHFQIEEVKKAGQDALEAVQHLQNVMLDQRELDGDDRFGVAMGNLDLLPEVTQKGIEQVPVGDSDA